MNIYSRSESVDLPISLYAILLPTGKINKKNLKNMTKTYYWSTWEI